MVALLAGLPLFACQMPGETEHNSIIRGQAVAQQCCSGCHQISRDQTLEPALGRPSWAQGPSFTEIAQNPSVDRDYLRGLASEFYFPMPAFHLQRKDQDDVISYILSQKNQL
jgi:mono/diheme cytochrome c family protein